MEILIPTIIKFKAFKLTQDNTKEFNKFVGGGSHVIKDNDKVIYIKFSWNPYGHDYNSWYEIKPNQYFCYNIEEQDDIMILDELDNNWVINYNESKN